MPPGTLRLSDSTTSIYGRLEKLSHHANLAFRKTVSEMVQQLKAFLCLNSALQPIAGIVSEVWTTLYSTLYPCVSFYLKLFGQYIIIVIIIRHIPIQINLNSVRILANAFSISCRGSPNNRNVQLLRSEALTLK